MAMLDIIKSSGVYLFRILEKNWRGVEKNRNETRCHPFPEPLFSEDKLAFQGGVTRVSQQDWCFPKNRQINHPKSQIFPKCWPSKIPMRKDVETTFPTKSTFARWCILILHLRRGRLLHVLRSINQRRWCFPCMTGIECPILLMVVFDGFRWTKIWNCWDW